VVARKISQIQVGGWPGGLFSRRDALILALTAAGLGFEEIARLRRSDVTTENAALIVREVERCNRFCENDIGMVPTVVVYQLSDGWRCSGSSTGTRASACSPSASTATGGLTSPPSP
jgi:hypothetical protein